MTPDPATRINKLHKAALHSLVCDPDEWDSRFAHELGKHENSQGYATLVSFAVGTAVRRRFSSTPSRSDVVRYVANLRATLGTEASQVNPSQTEKLIRFLLGDNSLPPAWLHREDQTKLPETAIIVFMALVAEAALDESGVAELINEAADHARPLDWSSLFSVDNAEWAHLHGGRDANGEPPRGATGGGESS